MKNGFVEGANCAPLQAEVETADNQPDQYIKIKYNDRFRPFEYQNNLTTYIWSDTDQNKLQLYDKNHVGYQQHQN